MDSFKERRKHTISSIKCYASRQATFIDKDRTAIKTSTLAPRISTLSEIIQQDECENITMEAVCVFDIPSTAQLWDEPQILT